MEWSAQPIWGQHDSSITNTWRYFRHTFEIPVGYMPDTLAITADSTYELFVNGVPVGRGPARGYPFHAYYDSYAIVPYLCMGERNSIAVLVNYLGDHTLSYMRGEPHLLCQLQFVDKRGGVIVAGTNESWRTLRSEALKSHTPRISFQMEYEEQVDARLEPVGWQNPQFDDSAWEYAVVISSTCERPQARPIPILTDNPVTPTAIKAVELARIREGYRWSFDVRHLAGTNRNGLKSAPPGERGWIIFTEIIAEQSCEIRLHTFPNYEPVPIRINEQYFETNSPAQKVTLREGTNLVMLRSVEFPALLFETDVQLAFTGERFVPGAAWVFAGVINEMNGELQRWWSVPQIDALRGQAPMFAITPQDNREDIFMLTSSQRFFSIDGGFCASEIALATPRTILPGARQVIEHHEACLHTSPDSTVIHPQPDGDVHLIIDFGREIIGYIELDFTAAEGTIIDANCFEGIDETGIFWTTNLRNSFRYICREGHQRFTSHRRRGFRYLSLTLRNMLNRVVLHGIRTRMSTYPVERRGVFRCSDHLLNQIWETAAYTVQLCMLDTYVDCPAYEQAYWVGDARNSALVNQVAFGAHALTAHCIDLAALSLSDEIQAIKPGYIQRDHLVTSHVVSGWFMEIPMWTFLWIWMIWEHYYYTGDREMLQRHYAAVKDCLERSEKFLSPRDLLAIPDVWNLVDWAAMDLDDEGEVVANTAMMARALDLAAEMAAVLSLATDADRFSRLAERLRNALNRSAWSNAHQGYVDTLRDEVAFTDYVERMRMRGVAAVSFEEFQRKQRISECTNTLMLLCRCVPDDRYAATLRFVLRALEGKFRSSGPHETHLMNPDEIVPVGSPWFLFFTLETLLSEGYGHDALQLVREQWKRMLDKGATTFWETFPAESSSGQPSHWSRSLCHGWSAAPAYFLSSKVLGVTPLEAGYKRVRIQPQSLGLAWAEGTVPTIHGDIYVRWQMRPDGGLDLTYSVPDAIQVEPTEESANSQIGNQE